MSTADRPDPSFQAFTLRERGFEDETVELSGIREFEGVRESIRRAQVQAGE